MASNQLPKPLDDLFTLAEDMADGCHTATPYLAEYTGAQAGQMAYYWLRWVNTRGEKGPWSEPVSATITG
jgi:predicted phage tail protein